MFNLKKITKFFSIKDSKYYNSHIINDFSEFSGVRITDIIKKSKNYLQLINYDWDNIPTENYDHKALKFYQNSQNYVYDLLSSNYTEQVIIDKLNNFSPLILKSIKEHRGGNFLEFGGGLGIFCEIVSTYKKNVTYLDIPGYVSDFALWRFKKYNLPIKTIISDPCSPLILKEKFDIIFSDAVLEHVINPDSIIEILCNALNDSGILILLVDIDKKLENKTHKSIDIISIHSIIKNNGLLNIFGGNQFCSIWRKLSLNNEENIK